MVRNASQACHLGLHLVTPASLVFQGMAQGSHLNPHLCSFLPGHQAAFISAGSLPPPGSAMAYHAHNGHQKDFWFHAVGTCQISDLGTTTVPLRSLGVSPSLKYSGPCCYAGKFGSLLSSLSRLLLFGTLPSAETAERPCYLAAGTQLC